MRYSDEVMKWAKEIVVDWDLDTWECKEYQTDGCNMFVYGCIGCPFENSQSYEDFKDQLKEQPK